MKKRLFAALVCAALIAVLLPNAAKADADNATSVFICGRELNSTTPYYHNGTGGGAGTADNNSAGANATFNASAGTLTLNGLIVQDSGSVKSSAGDSNKINGKSITYAIYANGSITAVLNGTSNVSAELKETVDNNKVVYGVCVIGTLHIVGEGTLNAVAAGTDNVLYSCGIYTEEICVNGGSIAGTGNDTGNTYGESYGVYAEKNIEANGGSIEGTGGGKDGAKVHQSRGVQGSILSVANGGSIEGTGGKAFQNSYGMESASITISGGSIEGTGAEADSHSIGVYANMDIDVSGGSIEGTGSAVSAQSSKSHGVSAARHITVSGGSIEGKGGEASGEDSESCGVCADVHIEASGGSIEGTGGEATSDLGKSIGVSVGGEITVNGGSLKGVGSVADSNSVGVQSTNSIFGKVTVNSGSLIGKGGQGNAMSCGVNAASIAVESLGSIAGSGDTSNASYGLRATASSLEISIKSGAQVLAQSKGEALSKAPNLNGAAAVAGTNENGTGLVPFDPAGLSTYKYFRVPAEIPDVEMTISYSSFTVGQAPAGETAEIESTLTSFNATNNFLGATMDGKKLDLGSVGAPGADGSVENGSIVIRLNQDYLNSLSAGTHTLRVNLSGVHAGQHVETQIMAFPASVDAPKTGDSATPMLWLGIALLAGAGLIASAVRRRRENG